MKLSQNDISCILKLILNGDEKFVKTSMFVPTPNYVSFLLIFGNAELNKYIRILVYNSIISDILKGRKFIDDFSKKEKNEIIKKAIEAIKNNMDKDGFNIKLVDDESSEFKYITYDELNEKFLTTIDNINTMSSIDNYELHIDNNSIIFFIEDGWLISSEIYFVGDFEQSEKKLRELINKMTMMEFKYIFPYGFVKRYPNVFI
jgi:hypothetical protein